MWHKRCVIIQRKWWNQVFVVAEFDLTLEWPIQWCLCMCWLAVWGLTGSLVAVTMNRSRLIRVWDLSSSHAPADLIRRSWSLAPARLPKVPENVRDWHIITSGRLNWILKHRAFPFVSLSSKASEVWPYLQKILINDKANFVHSGPQYWIIHQYPCL